MFIEKIFFEPVFIGIYLALVAVEFLAFLLLWRLNWRRWWQFFGTGFALGCSMLFVYHGVDFLMFALWMGLEMLIIRWICGIAPTNRIHVQ